ncbi:MAG TPA: dynamin family protein [Candidatus Scybalomonas excrementigallinarum]|nr:dynamin family protein [Candidatus Scybalomonas excrementigallinarum]
MGLFDFDEVEDILDEDYVEEESNFYLKSSENALELVSKILSTSKQSYQQAKNLKQIDYLMDVDLLGSLRNIQLNDEAMLQVKLGQLSDRLIEEKKYQVLRDKSVIGIGGKFSAGKSKFINSLLKAEEELLPEDQNPTTSIPTYIVKGEEECIKAYTVDNNEVELDIESMKALTHKFYKKYNMGFSAFIDSLIITEPDVPYENLVFLDTPGYSKADIYSDVKAKKNISDENKAYEQLKSVDYLIWLVDIENGVLSESDIAFINKLDLEHPILVVINKADKKIDAEIEEILEHIKRTIQEAGIKCFAVSAYSSRNGKEWNQTDFIREYLMEAQKRRKSKEDILSQISDIEKKLEKEIEIGIEERIKERNRLNDVIFRSDDIMEIKTLVDIYGESMESIRNMKQCKYFYQKTVRKLETALDKHYERKH